MVERRAIGGVARRVRKDAAAKCGQRRLAWLRPACASLGFLLLSLGAALAQQSPGTAPATVPVAPAQTGPSGDGAAAGGKPAAGSPKIDPNLFTDEGVPSGNSFTTGPAGPTANEGQVLPPAAAASGDGGPAAQGAPGTGTSESQKSGTDGGEKAGGETARGQAPDGDPAGTEGENRAYAAYQRGYYLTAMELALPRAQLGDPAAQTLVAELFAAGLGVPRSMDDAAFWYGQAAKGGDPSAEFKYALMLMEGRYVKQDKEKAETLMKQAAEGGVPSAQFNYAQMLVAKQPGPRGIAAALPFFERSARSGIPDAQYALSQIYLNATDIPEEKRSEARMWLMRAARTGYDTAELDLGIWLIDGVGGPKNYKEGFAWMRRAAEGGNVLAQNKLARLYINAIGTKGDPVEAAKWYILSRRAGLEDRALDDFYQGISEQDQKEALERANAFRPR